ncbi:peptidoglycan DD-metalloendopeptidase family protein [Paraliomyxa miuraensis]|uniref:peptidoglycan DD-metalloendopeptidase family protein n=1 Tax=Paraliomyxa miuraensis TaxID=376150 RepID=UPI002253D679|nr:peptidoglycan DD-metalloendopeptidase family protein [Paraliomyxa miuraensis]MCX4242660.1 peptidoglycan DD-metalloendopeptidase family protein [Paraliomyxa miuraensis]
MQWPLGECVDDKLVLGHLHDVQQDFDQHNTSVGRCGPTTEASMMEGLVRDLKCRHAGFDMHRSDDVTETLDEPVLAMADGEVVDLIDWGTEGVGVLVRHDNGVIANYVHLAKDTAKVYVRRGQRVRVGQPLGRVMNYPYNNGTNQNNHLHLEIRSGIQVTSCASGTCGSGLGSSCKGNGYALAPSTTDIADLSATSWGFSDPTDAYFDHRPSFPATIAVERARLDFFERVDATEALGQLDPDVLMASPEEPEISGEHGWYSVVVGEGTEAVTRYARGFADLGYGGDITIGEVPQLGRDWSPPTSEPMVDLRFGSAASTTNWGAGAALAVDSALTTTPPYSGLDASFCDHVADLDGSTTMKVAVSEEEGFVGGVAIDLSLRLDVFEDPGTIAMSGDPENPTWKLSVRMEGDVRQLVFEVTTESKTSQSIVMELPEPRCAVAGPVIASGCDAVLGNAFAPADCPATACDPDEGMPAHCFEDLGYRQWRHVAARYDVGANTFELMWDGLSVEKRTASGLLLDDDDRNIRIAEDLSAAVDDLRIWRLASDLSSSDELDGFGGDRRGGEDQGCACTSGSGTGSGTGGTSLLLLGLWALGRRRRH